MTSLTETNRAGCTIQLSDGRVAQMRGPDPAADRRTDLMLLQARFYRAGRVDLYWGACIRSLYAVTHIDGEPVALPPIDKGRMIAYARSFSEVDLQLIADKYNRLNPVVTPHRRQGRH